MREDGRNKGRRCPTDCGCPARARAANVEGSIDGARIAGTVVDDAGTLLATFSGTVSASGADRGTYVDVSGETGEWATEGTPLSGISTAVEPLPGPPPDLTAGHSPTGAATDPAVAAEAVRARIAALAAVPHPPDPRRATARVLVLPEEPDAPPRFDSGVPDPDRLEPPALPPRPAARSRR